MAGKTSPAKRPRENENDNETAKRSTKRPRYNYNDTISVVVGSEERSFVVHKDVVCASSKFFKAACSTRWKEGQEKVVRLPTVKPAVFEMYMDWLYFGKIVNSASYATPSLLDPFIHLSLLGDMADDKNLRNKAMDALQAKAYEEKVSPCPRQIHHIWENTSERSMLRKWALDIVFLRRGPNGFEENVAKYPPEFLQQIAVKAMQQAQIVSGSDFLAKSQEYQEADENA